MLRRFEAVEWLFSRFHWISKTSSITILSRLKLYADVDIARNFENHKYKISQKIPDNNERFTWQQQSFGVRVSTQVGHRY